MLKNSISAKIFFTVVSIITVGFGFLTYTVIEQEKKDSLKEKRSASELMAQPILSTIYKDMLDERADIARHLIEDMKDVKGAERVQIIRSNGIEEAFQDFKTLKAVEKEYGDLKPEWTVSHPNKEKNAPKGVDNPIFKEAVELFNKGRKEEIHYIEEADGKPLFTYLTPIEFRPKCNACHSAKEEARGILMISTSLEEMYAALASIRMRWIIYAFLTISGSGILLILFIKYTIKPLRRLSDAATDIANGNYDVSVPVKSRDEIGILADSFNLMSYHIKKREYQLKEAQRIAHIGNWELDLASNILTWSDEIYRIFEIDPKRFGASYEAFLDMVHPDDRAAVDFAYTDSIKTRIPYGIGHRLMFPDGRIKYVYEQCETFYDTDGKPIRSIGTVQDITEHKKAEEARFEAQQKYEYLINNLNIGIYRRMLDGRLIEANSAAVGMFEAGSWEEFAKYHAIDFYKDKSKFKEITTKLLRNGFIKNEELELLTAKGRAFWCSLSAVTKKDKDGNAYIDGIVEDISERKKLEEQLIHSQKMEAIGQLAGGVAHDFNNILTAILGYGNLLLSKRGSDGLVKEYVDEIMSSANRAAILTRDLLTFSRKRIINLQPSGLNELIERVKKTLTRLLGEHIKINTNLSNKDLIVKMDITQIEHVLLNLATNAKDAMPNGGTITITASPVKLDKEFIDAYHYGKPGNYALITFADTGIGIDKNILSRIFEPFFTTKGIGKGTGLGLSMVYGIIKQHDGYINVSSEPGRTVFKIYLPLMTGEVSAVEQKQLDAVVLKGHGEVILLAEDEADVRKVTKTILEEFDYKVIEAKNGEDAVHKFMENKDKIKLLIFDMVMPQLNGKQAYEEIKKINQDIKTIFISGYTSDTIKVQDLLGQGYNFLTKPVMTSKLLEKVKEVLKNEH